MDIKQYDEALDNLLRAKIIYEKISAYKDSLEAIIYKEKTSQIDTLLRLCSFNLKGMMSAADEEKLLAGLLNNYTKKAEIEAKVTKVKSDARREQIEKIEEITYNGKTVPLKTDKLKQVFKRVEGSMHDIQEYWDRQEGFEAG